MGVIAFNPMLRAGYDVKLAAGVITAGGTLGILIPPSVMIIVYAAVAGQSVVKLYAAAMFPGFFLAFLYLVYVIGWALINPKIAPPLPEEQTRVPVPAWITKFETLYSPNMFVGLLKALMSPAQAKTFEIDGKPMTYGAVVQNFLISLVPFLSDRRHAGDRVVVRRDPSAGRRSLRTGRGAAATRQRGGDAGS